MHEPRSIPDNSRIVVGVEMYPTVRRIRHTQQYEGEVVIRLRSVPTDMPGEEAREMFYVMSVNGVDPFAFMLEESRREAIALAESYPRAYEVPNGE